MPVSATNSQTVYDALKACGIRLLSVLPETWLVHLVSIAEGDPEMVLGRLGLVKVQEVGGLVGAAAPDPSPGSRVCPAVRSA